MESELSLQERYAPRNRCFGCGPANEQGLRIRSFSTGDSANSDVIAEWQPQPHHEAFANVLNGGIIGTLLDCHSNWTAVWHLMCRDSLDAAPAVVTADFHVQMKKPTPTDKPLRISARVVESEGRKVKVEARIMSDDTVTATCVGHFIAVKPGHPAYHRW